MSEHKHRWWKRYRKADGRVIADGSECPCGARESEASYQRWRSTVTTHRMGYSDWLTAGQP